MQTALLFRYYIYIYMCVCIISISTLYICIYLCVCVFVILGLIVLTLSPIQIQHDPTKSVVRILGRCCGLA